MKLSAADLLTQTHQTGRWFINHGQLMSPLLGATLCFTIRETTQLTIQTVNHVNPLSPSQFFACRIDDGEWHRWPASQGALTIQLTSAEHRITIMTAGNCDLDDVWLQEQDFTITGVVVDDDAIVQPFEQPVKVLVLGDSITAGCWVNGKHASVDYRPEGNYLSVASDLLPQWEFHRVAYSAAGVLRSGTGNVPPAGQWLARTDAHRHAPVVAFDLVVIALGVNDRRYPQKEFETTYRKYAQSVQKRYGCPVALLVPFLQSFKDSISRIGQELQIPVISTADWCHHTTDGLHPDQKGSTEAGQHFARALRQLVQ